MNNKFDELAKGLAQSVTRRQALKKFGVGLAGMALACFGLANKLQADGPAYTTIDYPGAPATLAVDINDSGQIVGEYLYGNLGRRRGFLLVSGIFTSIEFPGASFTRALGINRFGDIVGDYILSGGGNGAKHASYLLRGGVFTSIEFPNGSGTLATGINANGDIVGSYLDSKGRHGFLLRGGTFTTIDYPGADAFTQVWKINDAGLIAGRYEGGSDGKYHVFVLSNGTFASVPDVPGAAQTAPGNFSETGGLNSVGNITGHYCSCTPCALFTSVGALHTFLLSGGVYTTIDFPGATETLGFGVNSLDDVVGGYQDASGSFHGYLRTP